MECTKTSDAKKASVVEKLSALNDTERMMLLNKYSRLTEDVYCTFNSNKNIDVITKIFLFKFDNDALVEAYVNGDPVVDVPGCRFNEFLDNEIAN